MSALVQTSFANETTPYFALAGTSICLAQWSTYPATTTINASGNAITNISSLQIDAQILTANASDLFLNGVPVATIPDISNVSDWSLYPALSNIDANNFAISNVSGFELDGNQVSTLGNTILVNGLNPVSNWSSYQASTNVDMAGFSISNTPTISISGNTQNVALTASGTQLLVDGSPVYTSTSPPPSDTSNWANYPAVANVDMSGFAISNTPTISISGTTQNVVLTAAATALLVDGQPVYTGALPPSTTPDWALYPAISAVNMSGHDILGNGDLRISANNITLDSGSNITLTKKATTKGIDMTGVLTQCNVGGGSNYFESAVQMGNSGALPTDNLGTLAIYGGNVPVGLSTFYVNGGCTLTGSLTKGHTIGCLPAAGINTQRIDVLPVGINITTPTFITMNGLGAANIAMGGAIAIAAGSYVTLEHGAGLGANGIFVQDTARDSNAKLIFTGGGTLYNATEVQASNIVNPLGVRFYNGVFSPSGGSIVVPAVYGRAIVDLSTSSSYFATLTGGDLPTTKNSNSVFVGNMTNLSTGGATSTIAIGDISGMTGQGANSVAIGTNAGLSNLGSNSICIGNNANISGGSFSNTIILNATGAALNASQASSTYISPMRNISDAGFQFLARNSTTGEVIQTLISAISGDNIANWANYSAVAPITSGAGNSLAINASASVVLQHGTGSASNGIFLRNTTGVGGVKLVFTGAGTLYNADDIQTSDVLTPNGCRFYNGVYDPSGNPPPVIPVEYGRGVVDFTTKTAYFANLTTGSIPAANRNTTSVFVGNFPNLTTGGVASTIAIGDISGMTGQGAYSVAIGANAGQSNHGTWAIAVGSNAGRFNQSNGAVAIGLQCGLSGQGVNATAIGNVAGYSNQAQYAVAVGLEAGQYSQGQNSVAMGWQAGQSNQLSNAVAVGYGAGNSNQGVNAVAVGTSAGCSNQVSNAVAIGYNAGFNNQSGDAVAIGVTAGYSNQSLRAVAIGAGAGAQGQGADSVAIGTACANVGQGVNSVAIGTTAGQNGQGVEAVAIGLVAGFNNQGTDAVAIGAHSGEFSQSNFCTAVGYYAGHTGQGYASTGLGVGAGFSNQGSNSVAVGFETGNANLGTNSVAIGYRASSNGGSFSNTIVLNATGSALNPAQASSTYIAPLRDVQNSNAYQNSLMTYNSTTKEVGYAPRIYDFVILATSGTAYPLTPDMRGRTIALIGGTSPQPFSTAALGANDAGFFVVVHNSSGLNGGDYALTATPGSLSGVDIVHEQKSTQTGGSAYLYWDGTTLTGY